MEPYWERELVINNRELRYQGIFRFDELINAINTALEEKGYQKREKRSEEIVTEEGRKVFIELCPFKEKTNYATVMIKIKIVLDHLTEKTEVLNDEKRLFQMGDVLVAFDAWVLTDYSSRWGMKPWVYFMKGLINKYAYKWPMEKGLAGEVSGDTAYVYAQVKKLLNSYRGEVGKGIPEENVKKNIESEVRHAIALGMRKEIKKG